MGGTEENAESQKDCFGKDWGKKYPDKNVVVAFQDSDCFYDFVDQAQLKPGYYRGTIFVHPSGKMKLFKN